MPWLLSFEPARIQKQVGALHQYSWIHIKRLPIQPMTQAPAEKVLAQNFGGPRTSQGLC